jgi:hypothetical protein
LSRDRDDASFLREPLNFLTGHRTDEVGNVVEALLCLGRPSHAVGRVIFRVVHDL